MSSKKIIAKNAFFLYVLTFSNYFLGLILYPFLSRVLSVEKFGLVGFSMSFVLIFEMIIEYGFSISITEKVSRNRNNQNKINALISSTIWAKLILIIVSIICFYGSSIFIPMIKNNLLIIGLFFIDSIIKALLPDFYFRGIEDMRTITIRAVTAKLLCFVLVIMFVHGDSEIFLVPISFIIGDFIATMITIITMLRKGVRILTPNISNIYLVLSEGFLFFVSRLSVSINNSVGSFFLGIKFSPSSIQLGILAGITKITSAGENMLSPLNDSIYPHMVKEKDYHLLKKIFIYGGLIWIVGCTIIFIGADSICSILLGAKYSEAGKYLRIILVNTLFAFFSMFLGYPSLSPINKSLYANIALPIATIINIILCIILWLTHNISLVNILLVMSIMNIIMVIIRGGALIKFRRLIPSKKEVKNEV
ncbi:oligosaccharide flippase family protein [Lactococcus lactis]|uniref:oligosaccharide flippase family protein n=1 Tax=Lactococcus lactis TaxID=1358 RepID=UPI001BAAC6C9|nr:oligosaccharide flippase family protein [Lactococcus lactis]MBR8678968.1 oligosaccharide flippase family protein [Lactococcus lactis subsp. lactis]MBR8681328.1 oligosaccharide flippase family protein [Lactococcus lactis subsp. lactis]MBR8686452.1 oligosaccharide flippase family protein [Lactococcus lactis subsp. lactis]